MSRLVRCTTQAELDAALTQSDTDIWLVGSGTFSVSGSAQVTASGSAQVTAYDSAQVTAYGSAQVTAYDSAQVTAYGSAQVTAYDSAQVTAYDSAQVTAYGSAQVRASGSAQVTAYGSAQVTAPAQVTAYGSAQVTASGSAQVRAGKFVAVTRHGTFTKVDGGIQIQIPAITTPAEWCAYWDVTVTDGIATLYKGVNDAFASPHGANYAPGSLPEAADWQPTDACGNGLHFSPRPILTQRYNPDATKFVACGVRVDELVVITEGSDTPDKVKARRVVTPCVEVTIDGELYDCGGIALAGLAARNVAVAQQ
jgi:hypothetical protein